MQKWKENVWYKNWRLGRPGNEADVPGEVVVLSVQFGLLGLSQGATTVPELGSPSEQCLNAGRRVWLCEPGSMGRMKGRHVSLTSYHTH